MKEFRPRSSFVLMYKLYFEYKCSDFTAFTNDKLNDFLPVPENSAKMWQFLKSPAKNIFFKVFIKKTSYLCHPYFGIVAQALFFYMDLH
jgi:hypothetical protein